MERGRGRGCLKIGCLGCVGCLALVLIVLAVIVLIGLVLGPPEEDPVSRELARELPPGIRVPAAEAAPPAATVPPERAAPGVAFARGSAGRVVLDLSVGRFTLVAGPPGEPIRIDASFDQGAYELEESFEAEAGSWTYRVRFGRSVSWIRQMFGQDNLHNEIRIILPRDLPFAVEGRVGLGESRIDLGGLWVTDVDLETGIGEHAVGFGEPTPVRPAGFRIEAATGELRVFGLGHASPEQIVVEHSVGETAVGLEGDWRGDADVRISHGIGALALRLPPPEVAVDLERSSVSVGERNLRGLRDRPEPPTGAPRLRVSLGAFIGEIRVD